MEIVDYIVAEDKDLVKMSLVGDQMAFEYLFNRYSDAIRRLFLQRYTSVEDTEDLLQETFIKVYINLHRYSADYTFGQWVYTIARNTHIDFERRRQEDLSIADKFSAAGATVCVIDVLDNDYFVGDISNPSILEEYVNKVIHDYGKVDYLIKEIKLFDDKIEITLNNPLRSPDNQGFSFYKKLAENTESENLYLRLTLKLFI